MPESRRDVDSELSEPGPPVRLAPCSARSSEPLMSRLRLVLWDHHQKYIATLLFACLVGMSVFFLLRAQTNRGLIDVDRAERQSAEFKVDINEAQFGEIVILPGVGEKLAQTIVEYRQQSGPFDSVESLTQVPGIGEKKLEALIPYLAPIE